MNDGTRIGMPVRRTLVMPSIDSATSGRAFGAAKTRVFDRSEAKPEPDRLITAQAPQRVYIGEMVTNNATRHTYSIRAKIGEGGAGYVFEAVSLARGEVGKKVAIKIVITGVPYSANLLERFENEVLWLKILSGAAHPNILRYIEDFTDGNSRFLVTELLEGWSLADIMDENPGAFDPRIAVEDYALPILNALALIHQPKYNLVHRDLKPENIFRCLDEDVKLIDFGIAKPAGEDIHLGAPLTAHGTFVGTIDYMSPEQIEGKELDARSDLYSFGIMLYEMLVGRTPFTSDNPDTDAQIGEIMAKHLNNEPEPPHRSNTIVSPHLSTVVLGLLAKDPEQRYQTAEEVKAKLQELLGRDRLINPNANGAVRSG